MPLGLASPVLTLPLPPAKLYAGTEVERELYACLALLEGVDQRYVWDTVSIGVFANCVRASNSIKICRKMTNENFKPNLKDYLKLLLRAPRV